MMWSSMACFDFMWGSGALIEDYKTYQMDSKRLGTE